MGKCVIYIDVCGSVIQWESVSFIKLHLISSSRCVIFPKRVFCNFLHQCLPIMSSTSFRSDYEKPVIAHIITGIAFAFTLHKRYTSVTRFCTAVHTFVLQCIFIGWYNEAGVQKFSTNLGSTSGL
jgi:hypothetical protein